MGNEGEPNVSTGNSGGSSHVPGISVGTAQGRTHTLCSGGEAAGVYGDTGDKRTAVCG